MPVEAGGSERACALPKVKVLAVNGGQLAHVGRANGSLLLLATWPDAAGSHKPGRASAHWASAQGLHMEKVGSKEMVG